MRQQKICMFICLLLPSDLLFYLNMLSQIEKKQRIPKQTRRNQENFALGGFTFARPSISPLRDQLYTSKILNKKSKAEQQSLSKGEKNKNSYKVTAADESSNNHHSIFQQSIQMLQKRQLNEEYFQPLCPPLSFKQKKLKMGNKNGRYGRRLEDISIKLTEMSKMVHSQDKEIQKMKSSVSQKELHRLLKIHSIQKLELLTEISRGTSFKGSKQI